MSTRRSRASARRWLADRPIALKLASAMVVLALVAVGVGVVSVRGTRSLEAAGQQMQREHVRPLVTLAAIQNAFQSDRVRRVAYQSDGAGAIRLQRELAGRHDAVDELVASYRGHEADGTAWARTVAGLDAYYASVDDQLALDPPAPTDVAQESRLAGSVLIPLVVEHDAQARAAQALAADGDDLARRVALQVVLALLAGLAAASLLALSVVRPIRRRLRAVREVATALAAGDLTRTTGVECGDEVGATAAALDASMVGLRSVVGSVVVSAAAVAASAEELEASSASISTAAAQTSERSTVAAEAAGEVSRSVATVAAGAEEMGAAIREIARSADEAVRVAAQAVAVADRAGGRIEALGDSSQEIGAVVKVITSIAEQTNLLALNATIEAARAGQAGRGFAVVASEVKELARETARATEEISARVGAIQGDTSGAVAAIVEIGAIIARINDHQLTIASAVEEQTATTAEMSRSAGEAAAGSGQIAAIVEQVASAVEATTAALGRTRDVVANLNGQARTLEDQVAGFRR